MAPLKYYLSIRLQNIHYNSYRLVNLSFLERQRPSITLKNRLHFSSFELFFARYCRCFLKVVQKMPKLTKATTRKWNTPYAYQVGIANVFKLKTIKILLSYELRRYSAITVDKNNQTSLM